MSLAPAICRRIDLEDRHRNPLDYFRCKSEGQEEVVRHVANCVEVYAHAAERSGKSKIGAALTSAFCLGKDHLKARDGSPIILPVLRPPVRWVLGFDSYKLGGAAVMHTLRAALGEDNFKEDMAGGSSGCPSLIHVRHAKSSGENDWSLIYVFPYDGVRPRSMELDGWWCDEPPPILFLEALRSRIGAHRPLRGYITATPLERKVWYPIKEQYPKRENEVVGGRVRVRWSVFDNEALPESVKQELRNRAQGSAYEQAKLYGHHVDASGQCPWADDLLSRWAEKCSEGVSLRVIVDDEQDTPQGRKKYQATRLVEVWREKEPDGIYLITVDASSGVKSADHDPAGIHVWEAKSRTLVARFGQIEGCSDPWNGYIGPYGLGRIAGELARKYSSGMAPALVAPEANAWSGPVLTALSDAKHYNILHDQRVDTPGSVSARLGFVNSETTRPLFIGAVEEALQRDDVTIFSRDVVQCLRDCVIDAKGKIVAGPGYHDEDLILAGSALHTIKQRYPHRAPPLEPKVALIEALTGRKRPAIPGRPVQPRLRWKR